MKILLCRCGKEYYLDLRKDQSMLILEKKDRSGFYYKDKIDYF